MVSHLMSCVVTTYQTHLSCGKGTKCAQGEQEQSRGSPIDHDGSAANRWDGKNREEGRGKRDGGIRTWLLASDVRAPLGLGERNDSRGSGKPTSGSWLT